MIAFFTSVTALLFLTVLVFWLYPDYRADLFRHRMNLLKDKLDDYALHGGVSPNARAYKTLERTMSGFIENADKMSLLQILALYFLKRGEITEAGMSFYQRLLRDTAKLNDEQRQKLLSIYHKMNYQVVRHVILASPLTVVTIIGPLALVFYFKNHMDLLYQFKPIEQADQDAFQTGQAC